MGNITYYGPTNTPTEDIGMIKLFLIVLYQYLNNKFVTIVINDFYLHSTQWYT